MTTEQREQKITYTTMSVEQAESFNAAYDRALETVRSNLGQTYPVYINGEAITGGGAMFDDVSPNDTRIVLGTFQQCGPSEAEAAVTAAKSAFYGWSRMPWQDRIDILHRAAALFRERKYEIAAWLSLEAGKPRLESMGEVEEAADLIDTYCEQMESHDGFILKLGQLSPDEVNHSVLRPYGVWAVIAPFNFPVALTTGMVAGALVAGNTAVFKPSEATPLTGVEVYKCFQDAGVPAGVLNFVTGEGNELGEALSSHQDIAGIVFTGSARVGCKIYADFSKDRPRPCITEMGGKNPTIVTEHADLAKAVEGTVRAAFGYSGQKCSATSRVYVHEKVADEFLRRLVARTRELAIGDPSGANVFAGPVINATAYRRFQDACEEIRSSGEILTGGSVLTEGDAEFGYYCAPTVAVLPHDHRFFFEELFVPLVTVATSASLDEALALANDSAYGLTAGIFSEDPAEQQSFLDRMEAGVLYVNRRSGSTTGAWPGIQSFGGWKASGSPGKSALGPYYVQQFLREQNQTVVTD